MAKKRIARTDRVDVIQQGDVLLSSGEIPEGAKRLDHARLAEGEATGHAHVAIGDGVELFEKDGTLYLSAPNGGSVKHEEHKAVDVPAGTWKVERVLEFDHFAEEARRVAD